MEPSRLSEKLPGQRPVNRSSEAKRLAIEFCHRRPGGRERPLDAVRKKGEWWEETHEVHGGSVEGPWPHGDRFIVRFKYDVTAKTGPMTGKRMQLDEAALYTVKNGKVVQEEFFYHMG